MATLDALTFLFQPYALSPAATAELIKKEPKVELAAMVEAHYKQVSAQVGYAVLPPEMVVHQLASYKLGTGQPAPALALFQLNARLYPTSFNVHDSLGDYYTAQGQSALARASFTQALQLKELPATRQKLQQLQAKK
jgi:Flp pilus assembly protein TadD